MTERALLYCYKGSRCASCGLSVEEMVARYATFNRMFEFHHVSPDTKDRHYKKLMKQRLSRRQMDEIDKCVLLCTQCHAIIHAQEIKATLELSVELDSRTVKQQFQGWVRADKVEKRMTFVTNQPYLLELCEVRIGGEQARLMFLVEIENETNLLRWLNQIEHHRTIEVVSVRDRKRFMRVNHVQGKDITVTQTLGFPIMALEFYPTSHPGEIIFFRNGVVLMATGKVLTAGQLTYNCTLTPRQRADA